MGYSHLGKIVAIIAKMGLNKNSAIFCNFFAKLYYTK